ncbi:DprA-like winged helix domain-containing protein [Marinobacter alexandrii]|uniref:DprA-like winged helix domain-containing protein n=1 Tax=Marinobacter alexandrii TaxID=2570351 RepID=UPI001107D38D|nr:hypothetical protein [Marinobacter alexandrii]
MTHTPDEQLMQQLESLLRDEPLSIHRLHQRTGSTQAQVRQALFDLEYYKKARQCSDGYRWELVSGGNAR